MSTRSRPAVHDRGSRPVVSRARAATSAPWPPRTALVTGASSGIGRAAALRLADQDTQVLLVGRDGAALDEVAAVAGGHRFATDLAAVGSENAVASRAAELLGDVDLLVCCAGVGAAGPFDVMNPTRLRNLVAVNVLSPMMLVRAVLPAMLDRGRGRILLVGSVAGAVGVRGEVAYSASKAALVGFADALRYEVAGRGVSVTLCLPGAVDTPFFRRRGAPYVRRWPKPLPPGLVADRMLAACARGDAEVWVPGWMSLAARVHGLSPPIYRRLAGVFG
ncbi:SDR family NAD(P)-dependent oxidoreductase [Frankia sp. CNm7]|uniref:SDR family NAD(P)-dependent oxidoreductase n=1 Tax=Frankia nepalensis TaxID=1836974 RepID=A0A937UQZ0_9ACTN|nr:SDR family NAD(P)-dependent oxidoreductase [Frankia nepalensis]MBL7497252.1 SDR family NAD(P)-dependent oxidoreductase [Frankia nepalensis]MBL7515340.1 SDR family NAD(P)-dependent oxidoreductase [Frankia nepalensis]MBL7522388.1 SDR family NAD(P)-dependent oxidoreductase [Frankia nepalensis]MBL7632324.1 SDR family NAD(P)-dependent oxidoreductase [Frankia nepalensis]